MSGEVALFCACSCYIIGETALNGLHYWSGDREAEGGSLLRSCAPKGYRGFESPLLRRLKISGFLTREFYFVKLHIENVWGIRRVFAALLIQAGAQE